MALHEYTKDHLVALLDGATNRTLGQVDVNKVFDRTIINPKITGIAGDVIEQSVLGYPSDSDSEPDLIVDGVKTELKTTGLQRNKGKSAYALQAKPAHPQYSFQIPPEDQTLHPLPRQRNSRSEALQNLHCPPRSLPWHPETSVPKNC